MLIPVLRLEAILIYSSINLTYMQTPVGFLISKMAVNLSPFLNKSIKGI